MRSEKLQLFSETDINLNSLEDAAQNYSKNSVWRAPLPAARPRELERNSELPELMKLEEASFLRFKALDALAHTYNLQQLSHSLTRVASSPADVQELSLVVKTLKQAADTTLVRNYEHT